MSYTYKNNVTIIIIPEIRSHRGAGKGRRYRKVAGIPERAGPYFRTELIIIRFFLFLFRLNRAMSYTYKNNVTIIIPEIRSHRGAGKWGRGVGTGKGGT